MTKSGFDLDEIERELMLDDLSWWRMNRVTKAGHAAITAMLTEIRELRAENARLREANGILEDGLQEVGDDYPGSSCQEWCLHQIAPKVCENCQKAPATVRYDGEDLCRPCADYCAFRDIEEGDMEPGFGED